MENKFKSIIMFRLCFLLVWFIVESIQLTSVNAATIYIDYETGNDSNDGLSTATPWKHCPGDIRAADNANIILSPGDTVVFKGGSVYEFTDGINDYIEINASGSEGNRITYISGHVYSNPWGLGRAVLDCSNAKPVTAGRNGVFSAYEKGYWTIQGLEMHSLQDLAYEYTGMIGFDGNTAGNANYITIDDVLLYNYNTVGIYAMGESAGTVPTNLTIKNSTMYDSWGHHIKIRRGWDTVLIENNNLDNAGSDPYSAGSPRANCIVLAITTTESLDNVTIRGNIIGDSKSTGNKGLFMIQGETNNLTVEDNYFHGYSRIGGTHITGHGMNLTFRNNVYHVENVAYEGIIRFRCDYTECDYDNIKIYSNTFVSRTDAGNGGASGIIYFYGSGTDPDMEFTNVDIRNNIIDTDESTTSDYLILIDDRISDNTSVVDLSTFTCDYNAYQMLRGGAGEDDGAKFYATNAVDPTMTFTQWKTYLSDNSVSGADAHSTWGQVTFADESNDDFRLNSTDLTALDKGIDLSIEGFFNDKDGTARPQGSAWDIGAYEYIDSGTDATSSIRSDPDKFTLQQNYPNPFNPSTTIEYTVAKPCNVRIIIYNRLGQEIRMLVNEQKPSGKHNIRWDGKNAKGNKLASGVYFYRLTAGKQADTKRMLYLR